MLHLLKSLSCKSDVSLHESKQIFLDNDLARLFHFYISNSSCAWRLFGGMYVVDLLRAAQEDATRNARALDVLSAASTTGLEKNSYQSTAADALRRESLKKEVDCSTKHSSQNQTTPDHSERLREDLENKNNGTRQGKYMAEKSHYKEPISKRLMASLFDALNNDQSNRYAYVKNEYGNNFSHGLVVPLIARIIAVSCPGILCVVQLPTHSSQSCQEQHGSNWEDAEHTISSIRQSTENGHTEGSCDVCNQRERMVAPCGSAQDRSMSLSHDCKDASSKEASKAYKSDSTGTTPSPMTSAPSSVSPGDSTPAMSHLPSPSIAAGSARAAGDAALKMSSRSQQLRSASRLLTMANNETPFSKRDYQTALRLICNGFEVLTGRVPVADMKSDDYPLATVLWKKAGVITPTKHEKHVEMMFSNGMASVTEGIVVSYTNGSLCQLSIHSWVHLLESIPRELETPILFFTFRQNQDSLLSELLAADASAYENDEALKELHSLVNSLNMFVVEIGCNEQESPNESSVRNESRTDAQSRSGEVSNGAREAESLQHRNPGRDRFGSPAGKFDSKSSSVRDTDRDQYGREERMCPDLKQHNVTTGPIRERSTSQSDRDKSHGCLPANKPCQGFPSCQQRISSNSTELQMTVVVPNAMPLFYNTKATSKLPGLAGDRHANRIASTNGRNHCGSRSKFAKGCTKIEESGPMWIYDVPKEEDVNIHDSAERTEAESNAGPGPKRDAHDTTRGLQPHSSRLQSSGVFVPSKKDCDNRRIPRTTAESNMEVSGLSKTSSDNNFTALAHGARPASDQPGWNGVNNGHCSVQQESHVPTAPGVRLLYNGCCSHAAPGMHRPFVADLQHAGSASSHGLETVVPHGDRPPRYGGLPFVPNHKWDHFAHPTEQHALQTPLVDTLSEIRVPVSCALAEQSRRQNTGAYYVQNYSAHGALASYPSQVSHSIPYGYPVYGYPPVYVPHRFPATNTHISVHAPPSRATSADAVSRLHQDRLAANAKNLTTSGNMLAQEFRAHGSAKGSGSTKSSDSAEALDALVRMQAGGASPVYDNCSPGTAELGHGSSESAGSELSKDADGGLDQTVDTQPAKAPGRFQREPKRRKRTSDSDSDASGTSTSGMVEVGPSAKRCRL